MSQTDLIFRLALALIFGGMIGLERQMHHHMAGLRTNALVSLGAALFVLLAELIAPTGDKTRIAAQIVSGIGFLGAGVIIRDGLSIRGVNTAATLWCAAAVGALTGHGFLICGAAGAAFVTFTNLLLRPLGQTSKGTAKPNQETNFIYRVRVQCAEDAEEQVRYTVMQSIASTPLALRSMRRDELIESAHVAVTAEFMSEKKSDAILEQIVSRLTVEPGVTSVAWRDQTEET